MPRYHVYISQTLKSSVTIDALNEEEAAAIVASGEFNAEDQSEASSDTPTEILYVERVEDENPNA